MTGHEPIPARYHRQVLLPAVGEAGQRRLLASRALIVGCGALGCTVADLLARAGVGTLVLVDRDVVDETNLQRQGLFDEADAASGLPKALAAARRLAAINSGISIEPRVEDVTADGVQRLAEDADILVDGLDNFETRYLLNDLAVSQSLPWIYGGAVGTTGLSMTILPCATARQHGAPRRIAWSDDEATPCLRCLFPGAPPPGTSPTCDTAGILAPVAATIAARQAAEAIKILVGKIDAIDRTLLSVDLWTGTTRRIERGAPLADCPCCALGNFPHLDGQAGGGTTVLCGRDAVQVRPAGRGGVDLIAMCEQLSQHGRFTCNEHLVHGVLEAGGDGHGIDLVLFADGRAIFRGAQEPARARALYAQYVGD